jgi:hypothetical protein
MTIGALIFISCLAGLVILLLLQLNFRTFLVFRETHGILRIEPAVRWGRILWGFSFLAAFSGPVGPIFALAIVIAAQGVRMRHRAGYEQAGSAVLPLVTASINAAILGLGSIAAIVYIGWS